MRIEKINDNQIRCTLNKKDLSDRELRISELAYGTDKAKALFRDMVQQASYEFGFEAENIPLMKMQLYSAQAGLQQVLSYSPLAGLLSAVYSPYSA